MCLININVIIIILFGVDKFGVKFIESFVVLNVEKILKMMVINEVVFVCIKMIIVDIFKNFVINVIVSDFCMFF